MKQGVLIGEFMKTLPLREAVQSAARLGYNCVEIPANDPETSGELATPASGKALCDWIREDQGLEVTAFQCHFHRGFGSEDADRFVDLVCRMAEVAHAAGVGVVHTVSGISSDFDPVQKERPYDPMACLGGEEWNRMVRSYLEILKRCEELDVHIAIEPVFVYQVCNADTTARLLEDVNHPGLFINFDPSHFPYHREDPVAFVHRFASRIVHAHAKDARIDPEGTPQAPGDAGWPMKDGGRFHFAAPGTGVLDWPALLKALSEIGYDHVLSLEMGHGYRGEPQRIAAENLAFFRDLGVEDAGGGS